MMPTKRTRPETTQSPETDENILSMNDAARLLKTTRQTLYSWLRAGNLRGLKIGRQWRFEKAEIERFLKGQEPRIDLRADITPLLGKLTERADKLGAGPISLPEETEIQRVIAQIVRLAMVLGASHIHVHPNQYENGVTCAAVRYRIDGVLRQATDIDIRLLPPILEQWKILASLDPKETRRQQERSMKVKYGKTTAELQCQFSSSALGETLTVSNLLSNGGFALNRLGLAESDELKLRRAIEAPSGLVVFASPSASGRTTTVYACLKHLAAPERKIVTIEDRVERILPWVVQLTLHVNVATSFPFALRHFQRSDAEVVMIDYMPDKETIESAQFSALSGRLVLAGLYAADAATALRRMVEMGSAPADIAEASRLIVSQRLVRVLCEKCAQPDELSPQEREQVERTLRAGGVNPENLPMTFRKPVGCEHCWALGFRGRTAIAEVLDMTPDIAQALKRSAGADELRALAVANGMTTLAADGLRRAAKGETSLDEVRRVVGMI